MALFHITFGDAMERERPLMAASPSASQTLTANGTTTIEAKAGQVCSVYSDVEAYIAIGASPTAGANAGYVIGAGQTKEFCYLQDGWKVAIAAVA